MSDDFSPLAAAACGFGAAIFLLLISKLRGLRVNDAAAAEPRQPTKGNATVPVKLLQIDAAPNTQLVGSTSPFCLKVESVLRVTGIPHTIEAMPPPKAPKGKLPCIVHGANTIWDSQLISDYLTNTFSPDDPSFGGKLAVPTGERAAVLHAVRRMVETHFYWALLHSRFVEPSGWTFTRSNIFNDMPGCIKAMIVPFVRRQLADATWSAGWARHTQADREIMLRDDLDTLDAVLGDGPFYGGERPAMVDASIFAHLEEVIDGANSWLKTAVMSRPRLVAFVERFKKQFFADAGETSGAAGVSSR